MTSSSTAVRPLPLRPADTGTILAEDDLDPDVELLTAAGQAQIAWQAGDVLMARRWSLCLALLLMEQSEASGFAIWDRRTALTPQRRAGHDAWSAAWHIVRGETDGPGRHVDDLLPLVARFLTDDASAAA